MAGLVPAIHVSSPLGADKTWMPGTRPGMTKEFFINTLLAIVAKPPSFARKIHARKKSSEIINLKN
jgi:hypothetical protein